MGENDLGGGDATAYVATQTLELIARGSFADRYRTALEAILYEKDERLLTGPGQFQRAKEIASEALYPSSESPEPPSAERGTPAVPEEGCERCSELEEAIGHFLIAHDDKQTDFMNEDVQLLRDVLNKEVK